jgi:hypothetical protein
MMNMERIKELARLADKVRGEDVSFEFCQEFAQLIVSECCDFLKDTLDDQFAAEQLLEHFEFDN